MYNNAAKTMSTFGWAFFFFFFPFTEYFEIECLVYFVIGA
jgi:hypothetical protein